MKIFFYTLIFTLFSYTAQSQIKLEKLSPEISNLWGIAILNENETVITLQSNLIYVIDIFNYKYSNNTQLMINYIHPKEIYI